MKFFSPEVCDTFYDIKPFREIYGKYMRHLDGLREVLPKRVLELAGVAGIEDALIVSVDHNRERRVLRLVLRCGDLQLGYYNLVLTYYGADLRPEHDAVLTKIARSTKSQRHHGCDLAYHELDVAEDGLIEHRLIFHASEWHHPSAGGWIWFAVRCSALRWRREPKRTRRLPPNLDRYPNGVQD